MTVDLSPLVQPLVTIAAAVITASLPVALAWLYRHLKISNDGIAATTINTAVTALSQAAIATMTKASEGIPALQVKNDAIGIAMKTLSDGTKAAMALRGVTEATVAQRVDGEITKALAPAAIPSKA